MENKVPTLAELHQSPEQAFKNDKLNELLNQPPHVNWIQKHPFVKVKNDKGENVSLEFIPIDKIEFMLTRIWQKWYPEIISVGVAFQSVYVHVRLHYFNPYTTKEGKWEFTDGIGASPIQTDKDSSAADLAKIKSAAVQMALPAAKSYAVKDAAENFGKLFGRDLNRKGTIGFVGAFASVEETPPPPPPAAAIVNDEFKDL